MTLLATFGAVFTIISFGYCQNQLYQTNVLWGSYYRPGWAGDVSVTYTAWSGDIPGQIWKVQGIIVPISTTGRPAAPDPWNGYPTGTAYDLDKGHVMALSNGGSDISRNIVPQSAQWQRTGGWRQLEIAVYNFAMNRYGWNSVVPASDASAIPKPNSCDVEFSVDIKVYDVATGEPLSYEGYTRCGTETYSFTISPTDSANWFPSPPPGDGQAPSYNDTHSTDINDNSAFMIENLQIVTIIGAISTLLLFI